jgi:bacteriorhodopsin
VRAWSKAQAFFGSQALAYTKTSDLSPRKEPTMIEAIIMALIYLCLVVMCIYLIIWVLGQLGIAIPDNVMKIIWVIVVLVALLIIIRTVLPALGVRRVSIEPPMYSVQFDHEKLISRTTFNLP